DEELLVGLRDVEDLLHLLDQALLQLVAARGVDDDDVALGAKLLEAALDDLRRDAAAKLHLGLVLLLPLPRVGLAVEEGVGLLRERLELLVGGGAVHVGRDEADLEPLLAEPLPQLARGGGLALAVEADHHDGLLLAWLDLPRGAEDLDQLLVHDLDDVLAGARQRGGLLRERAPLDLARELEGELHVDVGLEERALDVAH